MAEHTKTPWKLSEVNKGLIVSGDYKFAVNYEDRRGFGITDGTMSAPFILKPPQEEIEANAEFIVRAVNSHDRLCDFARYVIEQLEDRYDGAPDSPTRWMGNLIHDGKAALALAGEE